MNYKKHYDALIERACHRILEGYKERHHIVPACMGGLDDDSNLVDLTPEEHFVAHQLLVKIHPDQNGLVHAAIMMRAGSQNGKRSNKLYGWLKKRYSVIRSEATSGSKNPMFGKTHTDEVKKRISELNKGRTNSPEHRAAISRAQTGRKDSDETRRKRSEALKGRVFSEETKKRMSESHIGSTMPNSMKEKTSERVSGSGNPMYGQGHKIAGEKNGMHGNSVNKGKKHFFCAELNKWFMMFPDDERMKTGTWRPGRK